MKHIIFLFLTFISLQLFAQKQSDFKNFLSLFPEKKLPFYVIYSDSDFIAQDYRLDEADSTQNCIGYTGELTIDSAGPLPFELVQKYLWSDTEKSQYKRYPDSYDFQFEYYAIGFFRTNKKFYAIAFGGTHGRFDIEGHEEQYLCTLSKKGEFISKIKIGVSGYEGTGICGNDTDWMRVPFYGASVESYIESDLRIKTGSYQDNIDVIKEHAYPKYYIDKLGNIKEYIIKPK